MEILLSILVVVILIAIMYGLYFVISKEQRRYNDEQMLLSDDIIPLNVFKKLVERTIIRYRKSKKPFTLILIDIDQFSDIKDTFNEEEERFIMKYVSEHIKSALPEESILSFGMRSDQFYVFVPESFDHSLILTLAKNIKKEAEKKIQVLDNYQVKKTVSLSIATYPLHGSTIELLLQALDIALYIVKKNGGNGIKYYTEELSTDKDLLELYQELKEAVLKDEFIYYYQPIVSTSNTAFKIYGAEALLRWNHPKRGILSPPQFLHLAEQTGELDHIGVAGVEQALNLINDLSQLYGISDFVVNINVSPRQILNEETFTIFQRMVDKYRTKEGLVAIEIPDFSLYKNNEIFLRNLIKIKTLGFKIAIDISTTDYDIIGLVEKFRIDMIKLNRNFFNLEDTYNTRKYLQMIIEFVHTNKVMLVAEGTETEEQFNALSKQGVDYTQGYFIAKPLDTAALALFLTKKHNHE